MMSEWFHHLQMNPCFSFLEPFDVTQKEHCRQSMKVYAFLYWSNHITNHCYCVAKQMQPKDHFVRCKNKQKLTKNVGFSLIIFDSIYWLFRDSLTRIFVIKLTIRVLCFSLFWMNTSTVLDGCYSAFLTYVRFVFIDGSWASKLPTEDVSKICCQSHTFLGLWAVFNLKTQKCMPPQLGWMGCPIFLFLSSWNKGVFKELKRWLWCFITFPTTQFLFFLLFIIFFSC